MGHDPYVVVCTCSGSKAVPSEAVEQVLKALAGSELPCDVVSDLCDLAAAGDARLADLAERHELRIAACAPRAVGALLTAAGVRRVDDVAIWDVAAAPPEQVAAEISAVTIGDRS